VKGSDKAVVLGVVMAVFLGLFYFKVLGPKRDEASSLKKDIAGLQSQIDEQKRIADFAQEARQHFPTYYGRLVVLGRAVPADADSSSLLVQLNSVANRTGVKFNSLKLSSGSGASATPASTTPPSDATSGTSTTDTSTTSTTGATPTPATTTPTAATEATAANLPLGASVGAAGLPTMPYDLTFTGSYFDIADFLNGVDDLVHLRGTSQVAADGRLLTVDGFSLAPAQDSNPSNPTLDVTLTVTSYVTPSDEGLTAGATPGGPAPTIGQPTQPASATVSP
jgi:Tfp pilus assembly protein PilO